MRGYAICAEQRTGSSFLCQVLGSTGALGRPLEYFNGPGMARFWPGYPQDPEAQLREITAQGATENGVYGVKVFSATFDQVATTRWVQRLPNLHFVALTRRDLLGQAISSLRARQTLQYSVFDEQHRPLAYDRSQILQELHRLALGHARWNAFFARCGLSPLYLEYEEVAQDPQAAADAVARLVGVGLPVPIDPAQIYTKVQRDTVSDEWRARFIAEAGDTTTIDKLVPPIAVQIKAAAFRRLRGLTSALRR